MHSKNHQNLISTFVLPGHLILFGARLRRTPFPFLLFLQRGPSARAICFPPIFFRRAPSARATSFLPVFSARAFGAHRFLPSFPPIVSFPPSLFHRLVQSQVSNPRILAQQQHVKVNQKELEAPGLSRAPRAREVPTLHNPSSKWLWRAKPRIHDSEL